jgi:hypothetical protein
LGTGHHRHECSVRCLQGRVDIQVYIDLFRTIRRPDAKGVSTRPQSDDRLARVSGATVSVLIDGQFQGLCQRRVQWLMGAWCCRLRRPV